VLIGLIEGVSVGILMAVLGVSQFLPLAALTVVAAFFPIVGAVAAGVVAVLVTLVEAGPGRAVIAAAAILVLQQVDGDLLQPLVMGQSVRLHPVAILLALTTGGLVAGIAGAFLAVPLTAAIAAAANELRHLREEAVLQLPTSGTSPPGRVP
jgi:putative heme transporter